MIKLKKDKFSNARGGHSKLLAIYCRNCENFVCKYQKDGFGSLKRLYLDRILFPENLTNLQMTAINNISILKCAKCGDALGVPYVYLKEKRKAFRLYQCSVNMKKIF